jgi:hypothetical protein
MSKITNVIAALVVSLTLSSVASASVITTGTLEYNNVSNVITDSNSGETYLGWDKVKDLDYAQTVAITSAGGFYADWHIASQTEAYSFYNAATGAGLLDFVGGQYEVRGVDAFVDGEPFGESADPYYDIAFFLSDEAAEVGFLELFDSNRDHTLTIDDDWGSIVTANTFSLSGTLPGESRHTGWLLVGGSTTKLPEPSIIALFGLGLVGIGFARRKRQS